MTFFVCLTIPYLFFFPPLPPPLKIMENGYAYEANGSVYFDLEKYDKERGYSALVPKQEKEEPQEETREVLYSFFVI